MAREPRSNDFEVDVEGVGTFRFGYRTMRDEIRIQSEYAKLIDGAIPTPWLDLVCGWIASLRVLIVRAPEGWDMDELDPLDDDTYQKLMRVHGGLSEMEKSFRPKLAKGREGDGKGGVSEPGVLVSEEVQPSAD